MLEPEGLMETIIQVLPKACEAHVASLLLPTGTILALAPSRILGLLRLPSCKPVAHPVTSAWNILPCSLSQAARPTRPLPTDLSSGHCQGIPDPCPKVRVPCAFFQVIVRIK